MSSGLKELSMGCAAAAVVFLLSLALSVQAGAASISGMDAGHSSDVVDCNGGCLVAACNTVSCTVWHCDAADCDRKGAFEHVPASQNASSPIASPEHPVAMSMHEGVAFAKACKGNTCRIYALTADKAVRAGNVENVDDTIRRLRAQFEKGS